jgi:hypothetical protein
MPMPSSLVIVNGTTRVLKSDIPAFIHSVMICAAETVKRSMQEMAALTLKDVNLKRFHVADEEDLSDLVPRRS